MMTKNANSPFSVGLPALYLVAFLSGISLGLFNPFVSTLMKEKGYDNIVIGANSTLYFFVIAAGTPIVASILRQIGLRKTMMLGFLLMGITAPLFAFTTQLSLWFIIRGVMGLACCLYLISGQTAINYFCNDQNRAMVNGLDALAFSLGFGIGPIMGAVAYNLSPKITFLLGSGLILSGIVVVFFGLPEKTVKFQKPNFSIIQKLKLPLQGAFAYGFSVATLVSLYPLCLLEQNYGIERIGLIFGLFILGGLISTVPITHLADKMGTVKVLVGSVIIVIVSVFGLSLIENPMITPFLAFVSGVGMSPIFPLSLALIGSTVTLNELSSGSAVFTSIYSAGCTAGPILSAIVMTMMGTRYIFSLMLVIFVLFLLSLSQSQKSHPDYQHSSENS
ncbi:MAG: MFS transporter [Microcystis sp.]|jgi:MFS family permease|uniref:MFS transporter n=1 Tax=unclassified Microcystis TaxID=2643300 RepID=UPI00119134B5|nr:MULTISPECIES: MFS transporter [unclassified Microcystis]NCS05370.1 MFS transporter [Microcystis aeruginosa G13-07]NCS38649.1 MFS transporter [Microcystis aeruginosa BS13-10]TRT83192.1 MAG: MFS transporter [Microcystis aeruginosa Ma_AC_P_19900807_S299]TRU60061.1 MAG: MFS transporter [Microcystis aeruginosa Ma_QC_C_20070823_S13]TRU62146.1 MAG: MFS transporter [Microcystis aeruginosa Ma_QC_C_20070823_S13D]